jgi:hypothetical protein
MLSDTVIRVMPAEQKRVLWPVHLCGMTACLMSSCFYRYEELLKAKAGGKK